MSNEMARQTVISELYNLYAANGFITEDEALACFAAYKIPLSEIDSISEHLLGLGVLIRTGEAEDMDGAFSDRSKLDYNKVFRELLKIEPGLEMLIDYVREITPPQTREWQKLIPQIQSGNKYAQIRLIEMYLKTVIKQALYLSKRYKLPLDDTIQNGVIGIMLAVQKFDIATHEKFSTYAPWWVSQSISRNKWISSNSMYFSAHVKEALFQIQEQVDEHICAACYDNDSIICPTLCAEIGEKYDMTAAEAGELVFYLKQCSSIDDFGDGEARVFSDDGLLSEIMCENADTAEMFIRVRKSMVQIKEREQRVLTLRFGLVDGNEHTLEEVGGALHITRERVRQIEAKALRKLRKKFGIKEPDKKTSEG